MTVTSTTFRMGTTLKEELRQPMSNLGLDMGTHLVMLTEQAVREQDIPSEITIDVPNVETIKAIQDIRNGIGSSKGFSSVSALMEEPDVDD